MNQTRTTYSPALLPFGLIFLFLVQNIVFNFWVHLSPNPEFYFFVLQSISLGTLLFGPAIFFPSRPRYFYLITISLIVSLILSSQYLYFSFYGGFMQASALRYADQAGAEWSTIIRLLNPRILFFFLQFPLIALYVYLKHKDKFIEKILDKKEKLILVGITTFVVLFGYGLLLASGGDGWKKFKNPSQTLHDINSFAFSPNQVVQRASIGNYYLGDVIGMALRAIPITNDDVSFVQNIIDTKAPLHSDKYKGIAKGKNLIFLQIESLDAAVIGKKVEGQEITPNLNRLAKEGVYFDNYFTQIGPGNTADAEFVTLTSLYPLTNTVAFVDFANNKFNALPSLLASNGYHTYALHGDVPNFWNRANIYPGLGYQKQISKDSFIATENGFETLDDKDFLDQTAVKMKDFKTPFMATAITLSSHTPFLIPKEYQTLQISDNSPFSETQKNYLISIRYTDEAIGAFMNKLKEEGLYDNSLIAIYGDHGSFTGTTDKLNPGSAPIALTNSKVPLILLSNDLNKTVHGSLSTPGSHLDLYPTVASLLGIQVPQVIFGKNLLDPVGAVMTHRDPYTDIITNIITPSISYANTNDGVFANGTCTNSATKKQISIDDCSKLFNAQLENIKASDLIVRGNLLNRLKLVNK